MSQIGPSGLFLTTRAAHMGLILYAIWRIRQRAAAAAEEKSAFVSQPIARVATPETLALHPSAEDELEDAPAPDPGAENGAENGENGQRIEPDAPENAPRH